MKSKLAPSKNVEDRTGDNPFGALMMSEAAEEAMWKAGAKRLNKERVETRARNKKLPIDSPIRKMVTGMDRTRAKMKAKPISDKKWVPVPTPRPEN